MVFALAPNARRKLRFPRNRITVKIREMMICMVKQFPRVCSAFEVSFLPIKMLALGAPPFPTRAAKADTTIISGIQTPTPVRARAPSSGI